MKIVSKNDNHVTKFISKTAFSFELDVGLEFFFFFYRVSHMFLFPITHLPYYKCTQCILSIVEMLRSFPRYSSVSGGGYTYRDGNLDICAYIMMVIFSGLSSWCNG